MMFRLSVRSVLPTRRRFPAGPVRTKCSHAMRLLTVLELRTEPSQMFRRAVASLTESSCLPVSGSTRTRHPLPALAHHPAQPLVNGGQPVAALSVVLLEPDALVHGDAQGGVTGADLGQRVLVQRHDLR